jgi:ABC-type spermidine/putrescine transport system permease subunit II
MDMISVELGLMVVYRFLALFIAVMMAVVLWRTRDRTTQFFAVLVFIPFILRAIGVK